MGTLLGIAASSVDNGSWVFTSAQCKWHTMLADEKASIEGIGHPEKSGLLLGYDAQKQLGACERGCCGPMLQVDFQGSVVPASPLCDRELLTHSGLEVPKDL